MIYTGLIKRLANKAKEKQMYPEMIYAHEAKQQQQKLKKLKPTQILLSTDE